MNQLTLGITIALRDAFSASARNIEGRFRSLDDSAYRASRGINRAATDIGASFSAITRTVAAAAATFGALIVPVREAAKFQKSLKEIETIADRATFNMRKLRGEVLATSLAFGVDPNKYASGIYEAVSTGFDKVADAQRVMSEATKFSIATNADAAKSMDGLLSMMNAYTASAKEAARVSDIMFATVKFGRIRGEQVSRNVGMFAPLGGVNGIPMEELMGTYATMTLGGLSPEQAAQYLRQILMSIMNPIPKIQKQAKKLGMGGMWNAEGLRKFGLTHLLRQMWDRSPDMQSRMNMLSGRQAGVGIATLFQQGAQWDKILRGHGFNTATRKVDPTALLAHDAGGNAIRDLTGRHMSEREHAAQLMQSTLIHQLGRIRVAFQQLMIAIGESTSNAMVPFAKALGTVVGWMARLIEANPFIAKVFTAQVAAVGLALMAYAGLQLRMVLVSRAMQMLAVSHGPFNKALGLLSKRIFGITLTSKNAVRVLSGSFLLLGGAVALVRKMFKENWFGMGDRLGRTLTLVRALAEVFGNMSADGTSGTISDQTYKALGGEGSPLYKTFVYWFRILGRARLATIQFVNGFKSWWAGLAEGVRAAIDSIILKLEEWGLGSAASAVREWFMAFKLEDSSLDKWRQMGFLIGRVAAMATAMAASLFLARSALLLLAGVTAPLRWMAGLFGGAGRGGARSMRGWWGGTMRGRGLSYSPATGWTRPVRGSNPAMGWRQGVNPTNRQLGARRRLGAWGADRWHGVQSLWARNRLSGDLARAGVENWLARPRGRMDIQGAMAHAGGRLRNFSDRLHSAADRLYTALERPLRPIGMALARFGGFLERNGEKVLGRIFGGQKTGWGAQLGGLRDRMRTSALGSHPGIWYDAASGRFLRRKAGIGGGRKSIKVVPTGQAGWLNRARFDPTFAGELWGRTKAGIAGSRLGAGWRGLKGANARFGNAGSATMPGFGNVVGGVRGMGAQVGGFLGGVGARFMAWFRGVGGLSGLLVRGLRGVAMAVGAMARGMVMAFIAGGPLLWTLTAVGLALVAMYYKWDTVKSIAVSTLSTVWEWLKSVGSAFMWVLNKIPGFSSALQTAGTWVKSIWDSVTTAFQKAKPWFTWVLDIAKKISNALLGTNFQQSWKVPEAALTWQHAVRTKNVDVLRASIDTMQRTLSDYQGTFNSSLLGKGPWQQGGKEITEYKYVQTRWEQATRALERMTENGGPTPGANAFANAVAGMPDDMEQATAAGTQKGVEAGLARHSRLLFNGSGTSGWPKEWAAQNPYKEAEARYLDVLAGKGGSSPVTKAIQTEMDSLRSLYGELKEGLQNINVQLPDISVMLDNYRVGTLTQRNLRDRQEGRSYTTPRQG